MDLNCGDRTTVPSLDYEDDPAGFVARLKEIHGRAFGQHHGLPVPEGREAPAWPYGVSLTLQSGDGSL